jgi:hypothetical protein
MSGSLSVQLASRLRQAVQGCTIHSHGPVQAWAAIEQAREDNGVSSEEVGKLAVEACAKRIEELLTLGAKPDDLRIRKEVLTRAFLEKLFR